MRELSLNVMDIAQNSIRAGASLTEISVEENLPADLLRITVRDNGCGMRPEQVQNVIDPFFTTRTTRKVGLGVPLFKMEAEMTGGGLSIESEVGVGTVLTAAFHPSHVDMTPVGDMASVVHLLITCNPEFDFRYERVRIAADGTRRSIAVDSREFKAQLLDVPLSEPDVSAWILAYITEMEASLLPAGNGDTENGTPG